MFKQTKSVLIFTSVGLLAACGRGSATGRVDSKTGPNIALFNCAPVGGGGATVKSTCINCPGNTPTDTGLTIDTNLETAASFSFYQPGSTTTQQSQISLSGTAQRGIVFPAGSKAGLIIELPVGQSVRYSANVNTYLSGTLQETRNVVAGDTGPTSGERKYFGFDSFSPTTRPFDTVELALTESLPNLEQHTYRVFEFCGDGASR